MSTRPAKPSTRPSKSLDTFPNPNPQRDYLVHIEVPEVVTGLIGVAFIAWSVWASVQARRIEQAHS